MIGFISKLIICPITILLSNFIFTLQYTLLQVLMVGIFLAIVAHVMELYILKRGTLAISTIVDFFAAFLIVYLSQFIFRNTYITVLTGFLTAAFLAATEFFQHKYLILSGKTKKTED